MTTVSRNPSSTTHSLSASSAPNSIERIRSERDLCELLYPRTPDVLREFPDGTSISHQRFIRRATEVGLCKAVMEQLHLRHFGVLPELQASLESVVSLPSKKPFFRAGVYSTFDIEKFVMKVPLPQRLLIAQTGVLITSFPCEFREMPHKYCKIPIEPEDHKSAGIFAMYLPPSEMREVLGDLKQYPGMHISSAFAYIRYYKEGSDIQVVEIQSDFHDRVRTRSLKERYKHWEELLLLAFKSVWAARGAVVPIGYDTYKRALDELEPGQRRILERHAPHLFTMVAEKFSTDRTNISVSIPVPRVVRDRWSKSREDLESELNDSFSEGSVGDYVERSRFSAGLAEQIYAWVPQRLGFQLVPAARDKFKEKSTSGNDVSQLFSWRMELFPELLEGEHALSKVSQALASCDDDPLSEAIDLYENLFPPALFDQLDWEGLAVSFPVHRTRPEHREAWGRLSGMVMAPVEPSDLRAIRWMTEDLMQVHEKYLHSAEIAPLAAFLQPEFAFFTSGVERGAASDWWEIRATTETPPLRGMAIQDQKRHPSVRVYQGTNGCRAEVPFGTIGTKGGGLIRHNQEEYWIPLEHDEEYLQYPIHKPRMRREDELEVPSHHYWGGMSTEYAELEFLHTLGLVQLYDRLGENPLTRVAFPLKVGRLHAIPTFPDGGVRWMGLHEYMARVLEEPTPSRSQTLGVYQSASKSDVRLSQIVNRIFDRTPESASDLRVCRDEILSSLNYLFEVNGVKLTVPAAGIIPSQSGIGPREYQCFVNTVLECNQPAGRRLYSAIAKKLISSVAMVHGAGGHLGGGYDGDSGAIGGGATAIRNVDACGVLHDLDADVSIPWATVPIALHRAELDSIRAADLFFLKDTLYWFESLLCGREVAHGDTIQRVTVLTDYNRGAFFGSSPVSLEECPLLPADEEPAREPSNVQMTLFKTGPGVAATNCYSSRSNGDLWRLTGSEIAIYDGYRRKAQLLRSRGEL